jgi:hypothetical protein
MFDLPIVGRRYMHKLAAPSLLAALTEIQDRGLAAALSPQAGHTFGVYCPRLITAGGAVLSYHSWGIAFDWDAGLPGNKRGVPKEQCTHPPEIRAIFARHGWSWGGDWANPDNMHYQRCK